MTRSSSSRLRDADRALDEVVPGHVAVRADCESGSPAARLRAPAAAPCRARAASGRRSAASRRARAAPRASLRALRACSSSGRRVPVVEHLLDHLAVARRGAASGRSGLRRSRGRASASPRGSGRPSPASSARRRCLRCAGRTRRRGGARRPTSTARCARCRGAGSRSATARCGCGLCGSSEDGTVRA